MTSTTTKFTYTTHSNWLDTHTNESTNQPHIPTNKPSIFSFIHSSLLVCLRISLALCGYVLRWFVGNLEQKPFESSNDRSQGSPIGNSALRCCYVLPCNERFWNFGLGLRIPNKLLFVQANDLILRKVMRSCIMMITLNRTHLPERLNAISVK